MARNKHRAPLSAAPPPATSSSEEEEEEEEDGQVDSSSDEEEETHNSPSTPPPQKTPSHKNPKSTPKPKSNPKPASPSSSGSGSGSDSESDSEPDSADFKVKPIASKPMKDPKPTVTALAAAKRPAPDTDKGSSKKPKREKDKEKEKGKSIGPAQVQDEGKKQLFQRLWSEDDEIVILKGMIEYKAKKGVDPMSDADGFLEFIKKSLHVVDVKKDQIVNKVRRLKKKYENNAKKKKITNPHELNAFELSKKVWGGEGSASTDHEVKSNVVVENGEKENLKVKKAAEVKVKRVEENGECSKEGKTEEEEEKVENGGNRVMSSCERAFEVGKLLKGGFLNEAFVKEGMKLMEEGERRKFEEKWRALQVADMELFVGRLELYLEMAKQVLSATKAASSRQ